MKKTFVFAAAAFAAIATPVQAQGAITIDVPTADLDLSTAEGQARLESRLETFIRRACDSRSRTATDLRADAACRTKLKEAAEPKVKLAIAEAHEQQLAALSIDIRG